ncbi:MAG TPA: hypothetical protein VGJ87_03215 [Roseiflexaceae bacterium]|jgi:hypothetical protein
MAFQEDYMREVRENIRRAEEAERQRIAKIVEVANADVNRRAAEAAVAERQAEQERERARQEQEQAKIDAARDAYRQELAAVWVGSDAELDEAFPALWKRYQKEAARQALADQHARAREAMRQSF